MPAPASPPKRDFFVYTFRADGYPFYVGIGREKRASDRLRFIRRLTKAKLANKTLKDRVIAALDNRVSISLSRTRRPLNRAQALAIEKKRIQQLLQKGYYLTNQQHNARWHPNLTKAVRAILTKSLNSAAANPVERLP
jgi:hypothetical protein